MILCIDMKALKLSNDVQKDVNLEDLLKNHTKYYDSVEKALDDDFAPLDFSITVRSMYSNLVLQTTTESGKRYCTNLTNIQPFVHKGYDLVMYLASIGLMHNIEYKLGFDELMTKHSQFIPMGIYNPGTPLLNPVIYSHIIISDEGVEELPQYLKEDRKFVPISEIEPKGIIPAMLRTLIEVKEENKDEQHDNN